MEKEEGGMNTHAAFETRERVLAERQVKNPELTGYVRPLTEQELK